MKVIPFIKNLDNNAVWIDKFGHRAPIMLNDLLEYFELNTDLTFDTRCYIGQGAFTNKKTKKNIELTLGAVIHTLNTKFILEYEGWPNNVA